MLNVTPDDITEGPLLRALLLVAAPLLVQNFVQVAQLVVDLFWLGRLSGSAVAAVGLVFPIYGIFVAIGLIGPMVATQVLVSQRVGADDRLGAQRALFSGQTLALAVTVASAAVAVLFAEPLVEFLTFTQPEAVAATVQDLGVAYFVVMTLGLPIFGLSDSTEGAFIGWGDSRAALYLNVLAVGVNAVLDPILIFGLGPAPALGVQGAALGNIAGFAAAFLAAVWLIARGRNGGMLSREAMTFDAAEYRELVDVGLPISGQQLARQSTRVALIIVVFAAGGPAGLVAYTVGRRVSSVSYIPAHGLQQAAQSVVGQNLGADRADRANRATWQGAGVAAVALAAIGIVQWTVPGTITTLLVPDITSEALALSVVFLQLLAVGYPAVGVISMFEAGFNGARRTRVSLVETLVRYAGIGLPISIIGAFVLGYGVVAVFWSFPIASILTASGIAVYYRYSTASGMLDRAVARATEQA